MTYQESSHLHPTHRRRLAITLVFGFAMTFIVSVFLIIALGVFRQPLTDNTLTTAIYANNAMTTRTVWAWTYENLLGARLVTSQNVMDDSGLSASGLQLYGGFAAVDLQDVSGQLTDADFATLSAYDYELFVFGDEQTFYMYHADDTAGAQLVVRLMRYNDATLIIPDQFLPDHLRIGATS